MDIVAAVGSCDSSYVPRACEPTTITSGWWMIWQAVRSRAPVGRVASARHLQHVATLLLIEQSGHGGDLPHLDRIAIETGQDAVQAGEFAAVDQLLPAVEIPLVRLTRDPIAEAIQVSLDRRPPLLEAQVIQEGREPPVQLPRAAFGASQLGDDGASYDLEAEAHARQETVELVVADVDLAGEEAADARLTHTAESGQI